MSVLNRISEKFSTQVVIEKKREPEVVPTTMADPMDVCPICKSGLWWLPRGVATAWRCEHCQPPLSRALVARRVDVEPVCVEHRETIMAGGPVCRVCLSSWYVEKWSDETPVESRCCCGELVSGDVIEELRPVVKQRGFGVSVRELQ